MHCCFYPVNIGHLQLIEQKTDTVTLLFSPCKYRAFTTNGNMNNNNK